MRRGRETNGEALVRYKEPSPLDALLRDRKTKLSLDKQAQAIEELADARRQVARMNAELARQREMTAKASVEVKKAHERIENAKVEYLKLKKRLAQQQKPRLVVEKRYCKACGRIGGWCEPTTGYFDVATNERVEI